ACVADRVFDARFAVDDVLLRDHVNDLLSGTHDQPVHVVDELVDVLLTHLVVEALACDHPAVLHGPDSPPGYAPDHFGAVHSVVVGGQAHRAAIGTHRLFDVHHHATVHTQRLGLPDAEDLHLPEFVPSAHQRCDLRGSQVEAHHQLGCKVF